MILGLLGSVARLVTRPDVRPKSLVVCALVPMFFSSAIGVGPSGVQVPVVMTFAVATIDRGAVRVTGAGPILESNFEMR